MASHWNNKNAILRDLSIAQGREVPVEIENPVAFDDKPPVLNYTEETEEEFFSSCTGGGDFNAGPDYTLIQQMLDMVREANINDIEARENDNEDTLIEISKSDPQIKTKTVDDKQTPILQNRKLTKPRKMRNIAMESLIETYGNNMDNESITDQKLLKPDDFIHEEKDETPEPEKAKLPLITSPLGMFKKKVSSKKEKMVEKVSSPVLPNNVIDQQKCGYFIPSSFAGERYKTYLEKSKLQAQVKEDIWARAEREMKEIDARRKKEIIESMSSPTTTISNTATPTNASSTKSSSENVSSSENSPTSETKSTQERGMDFVRLPQHRHLLTGDCTVCEVLCVHSKED